MQKLSQKWCVVALLENMPEGSQFHWKQWPLHVTLAATFDSKLSGRQLAELLEQLLSGQKGFSLEAIEEVVWAGKVMRLEATGEITALHRRIIDTLKRSGAVFNEPQYLEENYIPHCSVQGAKSLKVGQTVQIASLSLVDMFPGSDGRQRKIVRTFGLG